MIRRPSVLLLLPVLLLGCGDGTIVPSAETATAPGTAAPALATGSVVIGGEVPEPYTLTTAIFDLMPKFEVQAVDHGGDTVQFRGARMSDVLARAGVELGESLRGPRMASYLLVDAADRYRAVYTLAEIDAGFGNGEVYLVNEANGESLSPEEGPFRLVAPGDSRPTRWVRQVTGLSVRTAGSDDAAP